MDRPPSIMIAIGVPHAGEPDEDHLDRERGDDGGGTSVAEKRIRRHVESLNREGPVRARRLKLYATALIHMVDAHMHRDPHAFEQAVEEATDCLHELLTHGGNGGPK